MIIIDSILLKTSKSDTFVRVVKLHINNKFPYSSHHSRNNSSTVGYQIKNGIGFSM